MNPLQVVLMVMRGIGTLASNPALGGGGIGNTRTASLLNQFATLVEGGQATWEEMKQFGDEVQALVDQAGEPSRGQWEAMVARDVAARAKLAQLKAELDPPEAPSAPQVPVDTGGGEPQP